jgi:predicted aspartyl protease
MIERKAAMARVRFLRTILMSLALLPSSLLAESVLPPPVSATPPVSPTVDTGYDRALRMTVPVMINGQGPFDFVVDTGADRTVISQELAARLNLPEAGKARLHAMGGSAMVEMVKIDTLSVSTNIVRKVEAAALPADHIGAVGLLGIDSLKGQRIVMDFRANTMRIEPSGVKEAPIPQDGELIVVTARTRLGQLVMVDADANGEKIWVVVDTGAQNSVANSRLRSLLGRQRSKVTVKSVDMIDVLGQRTPAEFAIVTRLRIGGVALGNAAIAFVDAHPFKLFDLHRKPSMLLGVESLKSFERVSVDFSTKKVKFLLPNEG